MVQDPQKRDLVNYAPSVTPYFFGYGSLVNAATHKYKPVFKASLSGYKRAWRFSEPHDACFLTIIPDKTSTIDGLLAPVEPNWETLDLRETAYDRFECSDLIETKAKQVCQVSAYAIPDPSTSGTNTARPILLSYLDTVIQGFHNVYGLDGVIRFINTTTGWEIPILDDRSAPIYPRAQNLTAREQSLTNQVLADKSCDIHSSEDWKAQKSER